MIVHELFEELQACNPRYQTQFGTLREAAYHCGCMAMFEDYLRTAAGSNYAANVATAPDVLGAVKAAQDAADHLPYRLDNIGTTPNTGE